MNYQTKSMLKTGLFSGLIFALLMAGYEYSIGENFKLWKFAFHFIIFGLGMAFISRYQQQKILKTKKKKN